MIIYQTIFGQRISLGHLSLDHQSIIFRVWALATVHSADAFEFASRCRRMFRCCFVTTDSHLTAMLGPIGDVYRDYFYRIHVSLKGDRAEEFLLLLRHNPLRPLFDRYLDGVWKNQGDFAKSAGLGEAQVSRIFKNVLEGESSGEISVQKLGEVFELLNITPSDSPTREIEVRQFISVPTSPTQREWSLILLASSLTRRLCRIRDRSDEAVNELRDCRDVLARYLSFLFGIEDYNHLTDFTGRVFRELLTVVPLSKEITKEELLEMVVNPDETSFRLEGKDRPKEVDVGGDPCHLSQWQQSVHGPILPTSELIFDPKENEAIERLVDSTWAQVIQSAWGKSRSQIDQWSGSLLAWESFRKLLREVKFPEATG